MGKKFMHENSRMAFDIERKGRTIIKVASDKNLGRMSGGVHGRGEIGKGGKRGCFSYAFHRS